MYHKEICKCPPSRASHDHDCSKSAILHYFYPQPQVKHADRKLTTTKCIFCQQDSRFPDFSCAFGPYQAVWATIKSLYLTYQNIFSSLCGSSFWESTCCLTSPHLTPITVPIMLSLQLRSNSEHWCKCWLPRNTWWWLEPVILVLALTLTGQKAVSKDQMSQGAMRSRDPRFSLFHHGLLWFGG